MIIWTFVVLLMVVGVKYFTSMEMRKLERRLETVKSGLQQVKERLKSAQARQTEVQHEEDNFVNRVSTMSEILQDQQCRLSNNNEPAEKTISESMPHTGF